MHTIFTILANLTATAELYPEDGVPYIRTQSLATESQPGSTVVARAPETRLRDVAMHPLGDANQRTQSRRAIFEDPTFHPTDPMRPHTNGRPEAQNQVPQGMLRS